MEGEVRKNKQVTVTLTPELVEYLKSRYVDTGEYASVPAAIRSLLVRMMNESK
jgi:Arc/MetJ-type ribon-helix-helix transcriptional regulator